MKLSVFTGGASAPLSLGGGITDAQAQEATPVPLDLSPSTTPGTASPTYALAGIIGLLMLAAYAQNQANDGKKDPSPFGINVYSFLVIGSLAMVFSLGGKIITAKYPIPGVSDLFRAS